MKSIIWMGRSRDDLVAFPPDARRDAGYQLERVQRAAQPFDWKSMSSIGAGVKEIRVRNDWGAFRVIYLENRSEGIYVLHCFQKKTRKTAKRDLQLARGRFKAIVRAWSDS